MNADNVN